MRKVFFFALSLILMQSLFLIPAEAITKNRQQAESPFHLGLDIQTKYIWRGMEMIIEDSAPVVFPAINYQNNGFSAYVMGGYSFNGKYSEVDLGLSYTFKWLTIGINDYYYPTTATPYDQYFNFKTAETGHWLEAAVTIAPESIPVHLTLSNFFAGADKDLNGNQAFSTYAELGGHYDFLDNHLLSLAVGAALNKSCYNGYERGFSVCNVELKYTYNLALDKGFVLPLSVAYIINPVYQKSHINFSVNFVF